MQRSETAASGFHLTEPQLVYPIGMMLLGTAFLAVPMYMAKQSQIICYIIVGGFIQLGGYHEKMQLSDKTGAALFDLGILFVLFMGGMEVDINALKKSWKVVLINGGGQIGLNLAVFAGMAAGLKNGAFKGVGDAGVVYFGLCSTLSSTILVLGALKSRGEMESLHGQIILGIMVMQDITAVMAIAIMGAFDPNAVDVNIGQTVGFILLWFALLLLFLYLLNRFVLDRIFRFFAVTSELLFICTFAYSLGVAAMFGHFLPGWTKAGNFSQEIGIFFAGVSIAQLPYRVQIETFVEPIKALGVVLFFFFLGIGLPLRDTAVLLEALPFGILLAFLTCFVLPSLLWITGYLAGLDGKTSFMLGHIVNQISEFSLIVASIAVGLGIFTKVMYLTIVIGTLITFVFSSIGHVHADAIYDKVVSKVLGPLLDARSWIKDDRVEEFHMSHHVVIMGFNEIALEISEFFRLSENKDVLVIQDDPALHDVFTNLYEQGHQEGAGGGDKSAVGTNIYSQYANPNNPDTWHHYGFHHASLVVSCQQGTTESDCILAHDLKHSEVPFLCLAESNMEARVLYEAGVRYVIQSEGLAACTLKSMMMSEPLEKGRFMMQHIVTQKKDMQANDVDPSRRLLAPFL